jgi:membrane protein
MLGLGLAIGLGAAAADRRPPGPRREESPPPDRPGRDARSPFEIPWRGWRQVVVRAAGEFGRDQIPLVAAGATFFGLLALFPAIGAFVSLWGLFANVDDARHQIDSLRGLLPSGALSVIGEQMTRLSQTSHGRLGLTLAVSLAISLWSSNAGVKALFNGLNVAYEETERRNVVMLNLLSLAFTIAATAFALVSVFAVVAVPEALNKIGLGALASFSLLRWPVLLLVVAASLSVLYRFGPCRLPPRWSWITPGGLVAALGWMIMSLLFSWYVAHFGTYDRTYGSLGAIVGFMTWIWLSIIVVLFGAELNAALEHQTRQDTRAN